MILSILRSMSIKMSFLKRICILCALLLLPLSVSAEEHKHSVDAWTVTEKPTCTGRGTRTGVCTGCGKTVTRYIAPKGHVFAGQTQIKENVYRRVCSVCGAAETEYIFEPDKDRLLTAGTAGTAQELTLGLPEKHPEEMQLRLPAGEETELLFTVPEGSFQNAAPEPDREGYTLTLPEAEERKSLRVTVPARSEPVTLTVLIPEHAADSLTLHLPALGGAAQLTVPLQAGTKTVFSVTGQDTSHTNVRLSAGGLAAALISGDVVEIEYPEPVLSDEEAHACISVSVGGVLSIRLEKALDVGQPAMYAGHTCIAPSTQEENGASAAAAILVSAGGEETQAVFVPFWSEIRYIEETGAAVWVAAGAEKAGLPEEEKSLTVHLLGPDRSVYEDPDFRGLYKPGRTRDTFLREGIRSGDSAPVTVKALGRSASAGRVRRLAQRPVPDSAGEPLRT